MKVIQFFLVTVLMTPISFAGEVNSWDCYKFDGASIIGNDNEFLGKLGPSWQSDSIFNTSSSFSSSWSANSIFNSNSIYGSEYSSYSVFNENASEPPIIIKDSEIIGYLSIGPSWHYDRYSPYDIKYTCDWD